MAREWTTGSTVALEPPRPVRFEQRRGSSVVVKSYPGTDGAAVHQAMANLWASPLGRDRVGAPGMPEPLGFDGRSGELATSWVPGTRLAERGCVGGGVSRAVEVGILLADLHGSGVLVGRVCDRQAIARSVARKVADVATDPTTSSVVLDAFLEASLAVDRAWAEDGTAPRAQPRRPVPTPRRRQRLRAGPHRLRPAPAGRARAGPRLVGRVDVGHRGRARRAG